MRKLLLILIFTFPLFKIYGQEKEDSLIQTKPFRNAEDLKTGAVQNYFFDIQEKQKEDSFKIFSEKLLNLLFASEIGKYVTDSKNLTLQKAYAVLSTADKQLFLGTTVDFRKSDLERLRTLWTLGLKAKLSDDFSTLVKNSDPSGELGLNFKYTRIGSGTIKYTGNRDKILSYRNEILKEKFQKKVEKYIQSEYAQDRKALENLYLDSTYNKFNKKYLKLLEKKATEIYKGLAEEEIEVIKKEKLYRHFRDNWLTIEAFIPLTEKKYNLIPDTLNTKVGEETFMPFNLKAGYTWFWHYANNKSLYLSGFGSIFNNNNIEIEKLKSFKLNTPVQGADNLIKKSQDVHAGNFETFVTTNLKAEGICYFFWGGKAGLSVALEKNFGEYDATNWKLGLPVSLRDKDDKPTINFEAQWKEVNGDHFVGIGVGYSFGKFIN